MLGPLYGRENLAAFFAAQVRARTTGEPVVVHIVGDSKVGNAGQTQDGYRLDQLLTSAANGYPVQITYDSIGGQNSLLWAQTKAADFVAQHADVDLLIVDFGTNEGVSGVVQTTAETRANHLTAINNRIRPSRSRSVLSILLLGQLPCNNDNPLYNQTTANMVVINAILKDVAEQTNSAFFDPLELFARPHAEAGWMEQLGAGYGGGNVHPGNALNMVFVGELAKTLFPMPYTVSATGAGTVQPSLLNGWQKYAANYEPRATIADGVVTLKGLIKPGVKKTVNTVLFNLPVGFRPSVHGFFPASSTNDGRTTQIQVLSTGDVRLGGNLNGVFISLGGISYRVD